MKAFLLTTFSVLTIATIGTISCKHHIERGGIDPVDTTTTGGGGNNNSGNLGVDSSGWKCSTDTAYFVNDVLPLFISKCATAGCHDAISKTDGYELTNYTKIIAKGVSAGRATNSKIYTVLNETGSKRMPPTTSGITMTQAEKDLIAKWINQGAKNTTCNANYGKCDTTAAVVKFSNYILPLVNKHCNGCHTNAATGGNILLRNYAEIKASVNTGKFYGSIAWQTGFSKMPKSTNQLSACDVNKVNAWIKRGAPND
jgi:hypothetical protein